MGVGDDGDMSVENAEDFRDLVQDVYDQVTQQVSFAKSWAAKVLDFQKSS